jgi:hypothetical protein
MIQVLMETKKADGKIAVRFAETDNNHEVRLEPVQEVIPTEPRRHLCRADTIIPDRVRQRKSI